MIQIDTKKGLFLAWPHKYNTTKTDQTLVFSHLVEMFGKFVFFFLLSFFIFNNSGANSTSVLRGETFAEALFPFLAVVVPAT